MLMYDIKTFLLVYQSIWVKNMRQIHWYEIQFSKNKIRFGVEKLSKNEGKKSSVGCYDDLRE